MHFAYSDSEDADMHRSIDFCGDRHGDHECGGSYGHAGPHQCTLGGSCDEPDSSWWGKDNHLKHGNRWNSRNPEHGESTPSGYGAGITRAEYEQALSENHPDYDPEHNPHPYHREWDNGLRDSLPHGLSAKQYSTDGKIVGLCPGCNSAIRRHSTPHGDELRHLHNNHVRCHGSAKEAFLPLLAEEAAGAAEAGGAAEGGGGGLAGMADKANTAENVGKGIGNALHPLTTPGDNWAYKQQGFEASLRTEAGDYLGRPDASNPTGRGPDEYKARTWDAYQTTRPMQSPDDRGVNTPVLPAEPLKTRQINSPNPGESLGRDDRLQVSRDEDEEEE